MVKMTIENTQEMLEHHWAIDTQAATVLAQNIEDDGQAERIGAIVDGLDNKAIVQRDANREKIGAIFTGEINEGLIVLGPCSLDSHSDYSGLFDYIENLQFEHTDSVIALRANGAKPRSSGGWTGLWYSTDPTERQALFQTYSEAFSRGIPILTEITQGSQLGALAPWLSATWLGARDVPSTTLRSAVSAVHLPVGIKNTTDGSPSAVHNAVKAIRRNSSDNQESGVEIGVIASSPDFRGIPTGILPVGEGNQQIGLIARGYQLPENMLSAERRQAALDSLSAMCILAAEIGSSVLIDGTHDVPAMFDIPSRDSDRILPVLIEINQAVRNKEVEHAEKIVGVLAEVGPNQGKTDPNFVLDHDRKRQLAALIATTLQLVSS
jgi:phospho-2-dehydro-3-deoxyheptonate aldolase